MKEDKTNIGSQAAKERETIRRLFQCSLYVVIFFIILIVLILHVVIQKH